MLEEPNSDRKGYPYLMDATMKSRPVTATAVLAVTAFMILAAWIAWATAPRAAAGVRASSASQTVTSSTATSVEDPANTWGWG